MPAIGLYFPSIFSKEDVNAIRSRLNEIAADHGYTATRGPTAGEGNLTEMLCAIDSGEIALVLLPDEQRRQATAWLQQQAEQMASGPLASALQSIAVGLTAAQARQDQVDADELAEYGTGD